MTKQVISIGTAANDGTGDPIRTAFTKINANFTERYPRSVPAHSYGVAGDEAGMFAVDATYVYFCTASYVNNSTNIWRRTLHGVTTW